MMNMEAIVQKRTDILNYFFNESNTYTKEDILAKEYAALSFSPKEEYIDAFKTEYDDILTPLTELEEDLPEVLVKGIVVDVDMKKNYCIMHIQNKGWNFSISVDTNVLNRYGDYLQKGHLLIIKGHTYQGKIYMHFLIDYNVENSFILEHNYLNGVSEGLVDEIDYTNRFDLIGLVRQIKYFISKRSKKPCVRLNVHVNGQEKEYITCTNPHYELPKDITAGCFVSFTESKHPFINNLQKTQI